ncbi:MAG: SUF system NifU family Fe-S cluster assembly protein [Lachnospiraceae bacterium]|nr:SUF system NifU family Fe-S cluster assembly protein [Lachnospiraceae bacterium]
MALGNTFYNEILIEHNKYPTHKHALAAVYSKEGVNPSCGDDLVINLNVENGIITDGSFEGSGCAISQASADMMFDLLIGKSVDEAKELSGIFSRMIKEGITDEELERLEESGSLQDISHMPSRVKCAMLAWRTLNEILENGNNQ